MINGILTVYKEKGWTSHDVVAKVRRIAGQKKVGHTGTLDPQAEGVLPVCLGPSTRVCSLLTDQDKTYEARMLLGIRTDTQDLTGTVLYRSDAIPKEEAVRAAILGFCGAYEQVPPMYSALKVDGRRLYTLAREGKQVERRPRLVRIPEIQILSMNLPYCRIRVTCSKGTYIRTLCEDIGNVLGCGGAMTDLLRTRVGDFSIQNAVRLPVLESAKEDGTLAQYVISPDRLFAALPAVYFTRDAEKAARNGNPIPFSHLREADLLPQNDTQVRMYDPDGLFYGIYQTEAADVCCRPVKILTDLSQ